MRFVVAGLAILVVMAQLVILASPGRALESIAASYTVGDFETIGLAPKGWSVSAPAPNRAVVTSTVAISGSRGLLVEDTSNKAGVLVARPRFAIRGGFSYHVQGYAYTTKGIQLMSLIFYDASGAVVSRLSTPTTGATMVWSRLEVHGAAPAGAAYASIQLASSSSSVSQVYWDAISILSPIVNNGGFDASPTDTSPAPAWSVSVSGGASVASTTSAPRVGTGRLQMTDTTASGRASVNSMYVPVFSGIVHDLRAWIRPTSGSFMMTIRWYDRNKKVVGAYNLPVTRTVNVWSNVYAKATAPASAVWARIELSTSVKGQGTAGWDGIQLYPSAGVAIPTYASSSLGEPLDSFSNSMTSGTTTIAGRAKLYTVVSGYPGEFQLMDIETGRIEQRIPLEGLNVGWALAKDAAGRIYVGGGGGHLFQITPDSGALRDLGKPAASAAMIWDLETADDGRIWVATYPASHLAVYDPATDDSTDLGSVSDTDDYARSLALNGGYAYVGLGSTSPSIMRVSMSNPASKTEIKLPTPVTSGRVSAIESLGRFLLVQTPGGTTYAGSTYKGERRLYDTQTGSWDVPANLWTQTPTGLSSTGSFYYISYQQVWAVDASDGVKTSLAPTRMPMGRDRMVYKGKLSGTSGEYLLSYDGEGGLVTKNLSTFQERTYSVPFTPTKMQIKALDEGPDGDLYVGGFGGSSLSIVKPGLSAHDQYPSSPNLPDVIGEVEGSRSSGKYQYIGTYNAGKIFRYDTSKPWVDGSNPELLTVLGTTYHQDRPMAWASSGSRTFFGTVPTYGQLGGVLGILDGDTGLPRIVREPVTDQGVVSLAASGNVVYGGTTRWGGLGATPTQESAKIFAYDASTNTKLWERTPIVGAQAIGGLTMGPGGTLWAAAGTTLLELDPRTGATRRQIMIYPEQVKDEVTHKNADLVYTGGLLYLAAGKVYAIDPYTLRVSTPVAKRSHGTAAGGDRQEHLLCLRIDAAVLQLELTVGQESRTPR